MRIRIITILATYVSSMTAQNLPPQNGRFFYADLAKNDDDQHYAQVSVGQNQQLNLLLSTHNSDISVVGTQCRSCQVPNKYSGAASNSPRMDKNIQQYENSLQLHCLKTITVICQQENSEFKFYILAYKRATSVGLSFANQVEGSYTSLYDGYIGLKPSTNVNGQEPNFLQQLKTQGKIDHLLVSIYVRREKGYSSNIKFGSWDKTAILPGQELTMIRTNTIFDWSTTATEFWIGKDQFLNGEQRIVVFDPSTSFLFVPSEDWDMLALYFGELHPDLNCNHDLRMCYFNSSCAEVVANNEPLRLGSNGKYLEVEQDDMLMSGIHFGFSIQTCYLGIFENQEESGNWQLGTQFFEKYYVVLDQTNNGYNQIGLALKDPSNIQYAQHYQRDSNVYPPIVNPAGDQSSPTGSGQYMPTPVIEPVLPKPDDRKPVPIGPDNIIPNNSQTNPSKPTTDQDSNSDDEDSGGGGFFWFFFFCLCIVAAYFLRRRQRATKVGISYADLTLEDKDEEDNSERGNSSFDQQQAPSMGIN